MKLAVFVPCYVDQVAPSVAISTVKLLRHLGHEVVFPPGQTCCGQPAFNTGYWAEARTLAVRQISEFLAADVEAVVCPSGSCTAMQKVFYPTLLAGHGEKACADADALAAKTWELGMFLVRKLGVADVGATFKAKAALHRSCHALRELGSRDDAEILLRQVRGLELVPLPDDDECCGFGGTFAVKMADISTAMGEIKVDTVVKSAAEWVISGDSSCLMHLGGILERRRSPCKVIHLADVLAASL